MQEFIWLHIIFCHEATHGCSINPKQACFHLSGFYFGQILPRLGKWICGSEGDAYRYLHDSVQAFPEREEFLALMREAGLEQPRQRLLSGGIAAIYRAEVRKG